MARVMPLGLQHHLLARQLEAAGLDPGTIDLDALLDPTLSLKENTEALAQRIGLPLSERQADDKWRRWEHEERTRAAIPHDAPEPAASTTPTASFKDYVPRPKPQRPAGDRSAYAKLPPDEAAHQLIQAMRERLKLADITAKQKRTVVRKILTDMHSRDRDLATIGTEDIALYREFLQARVEEGTLAQTSVSHIAKVWNSTIRTVFHEENQPGEGLIMRGCSEQPRLVEHVTEDEFARMLHVLFDYHFEDDHDGVLFQTYLRLDWCCGARIGSLAYGRLQVRDLHLDEAYAILRDMKTGRPHTIVLSDGAVKALRDWVQTIRSNPTWKGEETPIFMHADGSLTQPAWINRHLKAVARKAGITQVVTSHVLRKSVGTIIAQTNPKFAAMQLGISSKVFSLHYHQPRREDCLALRHLLPKIGEKGVTTA